jgi:hypothetical protein
MTCPNGSCRADWEFRAAVRIFLTLGMVERCVVD